ncbi:uncharacterized protein cp110 [Stigmatopora argus]
MENYDTFVRNRLSHFRNNEEKHEMPTSSAIRFFGAPILPPVLTGTQREEMKQDRETALKDAVTRRLKSNQRLAYVKTILRSVQTRTSPTLEDLLEELKLGGKSFDSTDSSESSQQSANTVAEKNNSRIYPLLSTTNDALSNCHMISEQNHKVGCHVEQSEKQQLSQPETLNSMNHCSVALGSVLNLITEDDTVLSESLDISSVCHDPQDTNNSKDFFLPETSKTIARMPDIISYPPIDGEELERSGHESSFFHDFLAMNDNSFNVYPDDSFRSVNSQIDIAESQCDLLSSAFHNTEEGQKMKTGVGPLPMLDSLNMTKSPELPQRPIVHGSCNDHLKQNNPRNVEPAGTQVPKSQSPSANRPSLQDMLRQSQEYRREQRLLRNQGKKARIQEQALEKPRVEERSLSDKENNEFHFKSREGRKTKEKRFFKTMNAACTKLNEMKNPMFVNELICKKANLDSEFITIPRPQHLLQSQTQEVQYLTTNTDLITSFEGHGIYHSIPVPLFCHSPVHNDASSSLPNERDNFRRKVLINSSPTEDEHNTEQHSEEPSITVESSQHINKLESCLSTLKELISDLGSSLVEIEEKCDGDSPDEGNGIKQNQRSNDSPNGQSLDSSRSVLENTDEQINTNIDNNPSIQEDKVEELNLAESSLANTFNLPGKINENTYYMTSGQLEISGKQERPAVGKCNPVSLNRPVLLKTNSYDVARNSETEGDQNSIIRISVNQSLNVDTLSEVWFLQGSGSEQDSNDQLAQEKGLTPVSVVGRETVSSKVKRRLLMHVTDNNLDRTAAPCSEALLLLRQNCNTSRASMASVERASHTEELKQVRAAQVRAQNDEHMRQQDELCQALAVRYCKLQSPYFPSSLSGSCFGDTMAFSKFSQPPSSHLQRCLPLLLAAVKGYLTRRLLRTEKVAQLVRTIGDTQQFLQALQLPSPRGEICSKQDRLLQQSVARQLRAARYDIYDIFFSLSAGERMQLISLDRELTKQRVLKRQTGNTRCPKGKSYLPVTTQKLLQKKRGNTIPKKVSEKVSGVLLTEHKGGFTSDRSLETKQGWLKTKSARASQRWHSCRPR